jgi:hypothetical protein
MPSTMTSAAERVSWRARYLALHAAPRSELAAGVAVTALLAHLLLAQLTLPLAICFMIVGRFTRWRPSWLVVPAATGLAWAATVGIRPAVAGYLAGGGQVIRYLTTGSSPALARLAHLPEAFQGWPHWIPGQIPGALIVAAAETAGLTALGKTGQGRAASQHRRAGPHQQYRPGVIVAARRRYLTAAIRRGEVATSDGGCVGIADRTGERAAISWQEAQSGVLCTGQDATAVAATALDLVTAAIQRRKAVIIIDLASRAADLAGPIARACACAGAPLRRFGGLAGCYDPVGSGCADADPARAAALTLAMLDWSAVSQARQRSCEDIVHAVLAVIAGTVRGHAGQPVAVLDELAGLLQPATLRARLRLLPGQHSGHDALTRQLSDLARQLDADPDAARPVTSQLTGLRAAALGHWLQPGQGSISLRRVLAERQVALFALDRSVHGRSATMIARLVAADLIATLTHASADPGSADCLIWINGCEAFEPRQLAALIEAGGAAGTAVLLGTAAGPAAGRLVGQVNAVVVRGPAPPAVARVLSAAPAAVPDWTTGEEPGQITPDQIIGSGAGLAPMVSLSQESSTGWLADALLGQRPDALSVLVRSPRQRLLACCRAVR